MGITCTTHLLAHSFYSKCCGDEESKGSGSNDAASKRKVKRARLLSADAEWCVANSSVLTPKEFLIRYDYRERRQEFTRYRRIIRSCIEEPHRSRLEGELSVLIKTLDCAEFWKQRKHHNSKDNEDGSIFFQSVIKGVANCNTTTTDNSQNASVTYTTATTGNSQDATATTVVSLANEQSWILNGFDIWELLSKYANQSDTMQKTTNLKTHLQEVLALADILFLAPEQHSNLKLHVFGEALLKDLTHHQTGALYDPSEADLLHTLWPFVYILYQDKIIESKFGERVSAAVATAKNEDRGLSFEERRPRKISGVKLDVLYRLRSFELGLVEVGKDKVTEQDDKYLDDGIMKLSKTLREMLSMLTKKNTNRMNELTAVGYLIMGLKMDMLICDVPVGTSITRILRSQKFDFFH